ncbi:hypothetical protein FOZ62_000275, partial [Perkinsus olseni]
NFSVLCNQAVATCQPLVINPLRQRGISFFDVRVPPGDEARHYHFNSGRIDIFLNDQSVQQELHVSKTWTPNNKDVFNAFKRYIAYDATYYVTALLDKGLKVLVVNGDQDYLTNAVGSLDWMVKLKGALNYGEQLKQVTPKTVQGATIKALKYSNAAKLAFIEVTNAGHSVTVYDPSAMQREVEAFLTGQLWESA